MIDMQFSLLLAVGGHLSMEVFLQSIQGFLTGYYLTLAAMNAVAALYLWHELKRSRDALIWLVVGMGFVILAPLAGSGSPRWTPRIPAPLVDILNAVFTGSKGAIFYSLGVVAVLVILFVARRFFVKPTVAWTMFNASLLALGLAMVDQNFWQIVSKGDNIPIVGLIFLLGFFTWLATSKAVINDDRIAQGLPPLEKLDNEKVLVWPDLVYIELICMIALTAFLLVWAIAIAAPLEPPASRVLTPNPSKAPWYFLGLQEMLVYFDPWMAGVVAPSLIIVGLMAIPYLDYNKKGIGYYTINERKFAYLTFQFGFFVLWVMLIIMGTFLRGPNWNFFGPFELWDPHRVDVLSNVDVSQLFWIHLMHQPLPKAPPDSSFFVTIGYILKREFIGIGAMLVYLVVVPPAMALWIKMFRDMFVKMGFIRFMLMTNLLLMMAILPIKMALRWSFNLKYIIHIEEFFLNF